MNFIRKQIALLWVLTFFVLVTNFTQKAQAKSVYAIINHPSDIIGSYKIQGTQIEYQTQIQAPQHGYRAIDLGIDSDAYCIFVTYESSNIIEIMNAKSLENEGSVLAIGASNLAGIVFDDAKSKLYTVDRQTDHLFVYLWNATTKTLTPDGTNPKILTDIYEPGWWGAYGIALDTIENHLYVSNRTNIVHYYKTDDWSHVGYVDVGQTAVDVDIDSDRGYLYAGGYVEHTFLLKLNLSTGIAESNNIGVGVIGLGVDPDTGLVYTTTFYGQYGQLRVYDTTTSPFTMTDYNNISAGCGVCVPSGDVSYKPAPFLLTKDDNVPDGNCVLPDDYITYTIFYDANGHSDSNVIIVDHLPQEVDYNSSSPLGDYNEVERTVSWNLWTVLPDDNNTFTLTVQVNELAEPLGTITNLCEIEGDSTYNVVEINTPVCTWKPPVIYVDANATGSNNGMSWENAYRDLQDALERASAGYGSEIWVAAGTYKPATSPNWYATFQLVNGVPLYGGFAGGEICNNQRNWLTNHTILSGDINNDGNSDVQYVVTASDVNQATIIDGFTVTRGDWAGIYCNGNSPTIAHNTLKDNINDGVYCNGASPTITHNTIQQNGLYGIGCINNSSPDIKACWIQGNAAGGIGCNNSALTVSDCIIADSYAYSESYDYYGCGIYCESDSSVYLKNSVIRFNGNCGIYLKDMSSATIKNNWIHNNGTNSYGDGIRFNNQYSIPLVRNNTIYDNFTYGIESSEYDADPNIVNCIIYGNDSNDFYRPNGTFQKVNYCCLQHAHPGNGNITGDPGFMNITTDPNDLHIAENSPCKDAGDPYADYNGETDIDGEGRVKYVYVDIGADEYYLSPADFDDDLTVNFFDHALFANVWQSNDPGFSLDGDNDVDYNDLALFCEDWLWQAGWIKPFTCGAGKGMIQTMAAGFAPAEALYPSVLAEQQIEKVEPLKIEQLIKWLEELWLDEETQKLIDKDAWLKLIESLKEELQSLSAFPP
jgi:parallel beta-helix repeat protein